MKRMGSKKIAAKPMGRHYDRTKTGRSMSFGNALRRIISLLLCLCMIAAMLCNFGGWELSPAVAAEMTENVINRIADGDTTDTYIGKLLSNEWGSRYAGRVWTDKSVFANGTPINLDMKTDGYDGSVNLNSDFGIAFSALASSQVVKEASPMDVMFVIDISGSMGQISIEKDVATEEQFDTTPISQLVSELNKTIDQLMTLSPKSRFGIAVYGATAAVLVPLGHYTHAAGTTDYLQAEYLDFYGTTSNPQGLHFLLTANVQDEKGNPLTYYADNAGPSSNDTHSKSASGNNGYAGTGGQTSGDATKKEDPLHVGHITNPQAGFAAAMDQFITGNEELTWTTSSGEVCQRIPAMIHLTDGQASDLAWIQPSAEPSSPDTWKTKISNWNNVNWNYDLAYNSLLINNSDAYNASQLTGHGDISPVIFQTLMTAAYYKSAVDACYASSGVKDINGETATLSCFSVYASDTTPYDSITDPLLTSAIDAILNPEDCFVDVEDKEIFDSSTLNNSNTSAEFIDTAYELYKDWLAGKADATFNSKTTSADSTTTAITIQISADKSTETGAYIGESWSKEITPEKIAKNINYVPHGNFFNTGFQGLDTVFGTIIEQLLGQIFVPLAGRNDAGVSDSITYQDPLGEYMELKHGAITVGDKDGSGGVVTGSEQNTFDMSMLLFGEMHGMVRAGVYDYQWNHTYMYENKEKKNYPDPDANPDEAPLETGWYKGDPETAEYSYGENGLPSGCTTAEQAWAEGWVLRFSYKTLADFVPISEITDDMKPTDIPEQIKQSVYTCYRFADSQQDRNKLRRNPIFGTVPESLQEEWNKYFDDNGSYPVGMDKYSSFPGVYRLSDIRVWAEHTGDFVDQTGSITPEEESGYDDSLYVNIPVSAVPAQLAEITLGLDGPISYKDNLEEKEQSTPFRLFYAVGLTEDLIQRDSDGNQTGVDVSKISGEYIATHSDPTTGNISFISNWYSNTPYTGYASDDDEPYHTRGDVAVSFSPNVENRYYLFQKPLPLIAHAYRVANDDGDVTPVDRTEGENWEANGAGNGSTTWETVNGTAQSAASWVGGDFIGTYENEEAFKEALNTVTPDTNGIRYIKDAKGYTYPLPENITDAVITYLEDQLKNVDSEGDNYASGARSFSSDDYFFLCIEYYLPLEGEGTDIQGEPAPGTHAVRKVNRMIARKGSAFGSGLHSQNIGNGDMLCWTDINGNCNLEIEYNSRTDTGDDTRGRPTLEKLTLKGNELLEYLQNTCHLNVEPNADGQSCLELDCAYWESVQQDPNMKALIDQIKELSYDPTAQQAKFDELFDWSVAARTGGIRVGDMFNNMQAKLTQTEIENGSGPEFEEDNPQIYQGNVTRTANNYYIPTLSETSTAGNGLVINNYLGNNGRMEIANATLMVTKTLVAPNGFALKENQQNETFDYQVYVQGLIGERLAQRVIWNPLSNSWQKRVESLDILTDNSSLLVDDNGSRALFCCANGDTSKPRQIVEAVKEDGSIGYYYADATGAASEDPCNDSTEHFYYIYLPSSEGDLTYHLFGSSYDGYEGSEDTTEKIDGAGTTAYYPEGMDVSGMAHNDNQTFAEATGDRPAGSREYWTNQAELIPYSQVYNAENPEDGTDSGNRWDHNTNHDGWNDHIQLEKFVLVTVIPNLTGGIESTIYSPFSSRTQYMTTPLYFGYKSELAGHLKDTNETFATCGELSEYELTGEDVYDQNIPKDASSDLFNIENENTTAADVAKNTAEYTLKSGEGLLLTGLGNEIVYRYTEKLTNEQIEQSYTLKEITHVQQSGTSIIHEGETYTKGGIYSVFGDIGLATEQVHYTNTIVPELFVLTKEVVDSDGNAISTPPDQKFTFKLTFEPPENAAITDVDDTLHYWKGNKEAWTSSETWTDATSGESYKMPETAPKLHEYEPYLTGDPERLIPIKPDEGSEGSARTYTIELKENEAVVFYGLIEGTKYTVTETPNEKYPVVPGEGVVDGYTQTGMIERSNEDPKEIDPSTTLNRADFINRQETGELTVQKKVKDDAPEAELEFNFTVILTPEAGMKLNSENVKAVKYIADGTEEDDFTLDWSIADVNGSIKANFSLQAGEKLLIENIPVDTDYIVEETKVSGYNLQHVADNPDDRPDSGGNYLLRDGDSVSGTVSASANVYLLFVNEKTPFLPFVGGNGVGGIILIGVLLIGLATTLIVFKMHKRCRIAQIGG